MDSHEIVISGLSSRFVSLSKSHYVDPLVNKLPCIIYSMTNVANTSNAMTVNKMVGCVFQSILRFLEKIKHFFFSNHVQNGANREQIPNKFSEWHILVDGNKVYCKAVLVDDCQWQKDNYAKGVVDLSSRGLNLLPPLPKNTKELYLNNNALTEVDLTEYPSIKRVFAKGNNLRSLILPSGVEVVDVSYNKELKNISVVPKSTIVFTAMSCGLKKFPAFESDSSIEYINLMDNEIDDISHAVLEQHVLYGLNLKGNPLTQDATEALEEKKRKVKNAIDEGKMQMISHKLECDFSYLFDKDKTLTELNPRKKRFRRPGA